MLLLKNEKDWIDYRFEELEEKAGIFSKPNHPEDGWQTIEREDAYVISVSERLKKISLLL